MRVYIAGPMSGYLDFNFAAFNHAAKQWRASGHDVVNPAENDKGDTTKSWVYYMRQDLVHLASVDAVAVLPGWQKSKGATLEVHIARTLGLPIFDAETAEPWTETVLAEADRLTASDRSADYGHPIDDFSRTAKMMTGVLLDKLRPDIEVSPRDVPLLMNCVKMSREVNAPKRDNRVDGAGYWKTLDMVDQEELRRAG